MKRCLVLIALVACGGRQHAVVPGGAPGQGGGSGGGSASGLEGTTTLTEITSDGERRVVAHEGIVEVDVNSKVHVEVDRDRIAQLFYARAGVDPADVKALSARLVDLDALTLLQKQNLEQLLQLEKQLRSLGPTRFVQLPGAERLQNALGQSEGVLTRQIIAYAERHGLDPDAFFTGDKTATLAALDDERGKALEEARLLQERVRDLRWRMQAVITSGDKTAPIHLDNYDSYPEIGFTMIDKLVPQVTPAELTTQLSSARQLAKDIKDLAGLRDTLVAAVSAKIREFVASLRAAILSDIDTLAELARSLATDAAAIPEVKRLRDHVVALGPPLRAIRTACTPIVDAVSSGAANLESVGAAKACLAALMQSLAVVKPKLGELADDVVALEQRLTDPATLGAAAARIKGALQRAKTLEQIRIYVADGETAWAGLAAFLGLSEQANAPVWSDDQQTDRALTQLSHTTIDLTRAARHEHDTVHFRASLMAGESPVLVGPAHTLRLVRMGWYIDVSAAVLFVDKKDDHWGPFNTAPALVAALHHRWRRDSDGAAALNALRPGIGLHFAYPRLQNDTSFELGFGGSLLLFGDLVQVGGGYDFQANASYWYVGFGLNTLAKLGVRFSVAGGP